MATNPNDHRVDYIEFPATDIAATKGFYSRVFGWKFTDYGPEYTSFEDGRLGGGFQHAAQIGRGGALVVIYATALEETEAAVQAAGGTIVKEIFSFPGGRRFHFTDPNGNELAVWSE
jgi:predicted enzyme related to lactoylglutathione lyase